MFPDSKVHALQYTTCADLTDQHAFVPVVFDLHKAWVACIPEMSMRHLVDVQQQDENIDADELQKQSSSDTSKFLRAWAWKREHRLA